MEMFNAPNHVQLGNAEHGLGKLEQGTRCELRNDYLDPRQHAPDPIRSEVQLLIRVAPLALEYLF
jgi:hypothetical protein